MHSVDELLERLSFDNDDHVSQFLDHLQKTFGPAGFLIYVLSNPFVDEIHLPAFFNRGPSVLDVLLDLAEGLMNDDVKSLLSIHFVFARLRPFVLNPSHLDATNLMKLRVASMEMFLYNTDPFVAFILEVIHERDDMSLIPKWVREVDAAEWERLSIRANAMQESFAVEVLKATSNNNDEDDNARARHRILSMQLIDCDYVLTSIYGPVHPVFAFYVTEQTKIAAASLNTHDSNDDDDDVVHDGVFKGMMENSEGQPMIASRRMGFYSQTHFLSELVNSDDDNDDDEDEDEDNGDDDIYDSYTGQRIQDRRWALRIPLPDGRWENGLWFGTFANARKMILRLNLQITPTEAVVVLQKFAEMNENVIADEPNVRIEVSDEVGFDLGQKICWQLKMIDALEIELTKNPIVYTT
jgi:hypothetical protein